MFVSPQGDCWDFSPTFFLCVKSKQHGRTRPFTAAGLSHKNLKDLGDSSQVALDPMAKELEKESKT